MKVAILGTWHVHTKEYTTGVLNNPNAEVAVVWDNDAERGKKFADEMNLPFNADLDAVLGDESIDSVVICTATCDHPEIMMKVTAAKKNIFTEKVLTIDPKDAEKVAEAVKASGKVFTISYPHRTFLTAARRVKSLSEMRIRRPSDWAWLWTYRTRAQRTQRQLRKLASPPHFYDKAQCGGGAMIDLGSHPMYTLYWLLGEPKSITSTFTQVTNRGVEDNAVSVIEFADGKIGVSETGFVSECNPYTLEVSGTDGAVMVHGDSVQWGGKATEGKWVDLELPEKEPLPIDQWIDAVVNGKPSPFTIDEAVMLTRLMDGAYKAFETGAKATF